MKNLHDTITVREAADALGVSVQQVHRLVEAGTIAVVHQLPGATGAKLLDRADLERYATNRRAS
jgi:excisionase family DNA binding protein